MALSKLKLLKDNPPLDALDDAYTIKSYSLGLMSRHREAMENSKERYSMWAMKNIRNPRSIWAAFDLIECCIHLNEYVDAELFARTAYEIINQRTDNIIPLDIRQQTLARGAYFLARTTLYLAHARDIAEVKEATGVKVMELAREAIEINTQLYGVESIEVAADFSLLAGALEYFNGTDDDEVLRLYDQARAIFARIQGSSSLNVAVNEHQLGLSYDRRGLRALDANNFDRAHDNWQLALPHFREAARIHIANNYRTNAADSLSNITDIEEKIRHVRTLIAAKAAEATSSTR